ncbi:MAG: hypothetical protein ACOYJU_03780 [Anaerovoracaceae bacterium]|jgi:hypothetical protein
MKKRKTRNKARDMLGDYYKSNRMAEEENEKNLKESPPSSNWTPAAKFMIIAIIICLIAIVIKYFVL